MPRIRTPRAKPLICQCRCGIHRAAQDEARMRIEAMTVCDKMPRGVIRYRLSETIIVRRLASGEPVLRTRDLLVAHAHYICGPCCDWWCTQRPDLVDGYECSPVLEEVLTEGLAVARRVYDVLDRGDLAPFERAVAALDVLLDGVPEVTRLDPGAFDFAALAEAIQTRPDGSTVRAWAAEYGLTVPVPVPEPARKNTAC